ncbi:MAG: LamG-like jellyroll fold domain-containing protein, partial [Pirellula sp.]
NDTLELSLENDGRGLFELDSETGFLRISDTVRFRSDPTEVYNLSVIAMDRRGLTRKRNFAMRSLQRETLLHGENNATDSLHWNHAVALGDLRYTLGIDGNAFAFDGVDDSLRLRRNAWGSTNGTGVTYAFWMQGLGQSEIALDRDRNVVSYTGDGDNAWSLFLQADGKLAFRIQTGETQSVSRDLSPSLGDEWHFVSLSFQDPYGVRITLDNRLSHDIAYKGGLGFSTNSFVRIGDRTPWADYYQGKIDEFRFYDRSLSARELEFLYVDPKPRIGNLLLQPSVPVTPSVSDESVEIISTAYYLVDDNSEYFVSAKIDGLNPPVVASAGIVPLNIDRQPIDWIHYNTQSYPTDTILAQPLVSGDLMLHVDNATNWYDGPDPNQRIIEFLLGRSTIGDMHPGVGSRRTILDGYPLGGIVGNRIALRSQYFGPTIPTGTVIRNRTYRTEYQYNLVDSQTIQSLPATTPGTLSGLASPGIASNSRFKPGTEYILGISKKLPGQVWGGFEIESVNTISVLENQTFGTPIAIAKPLQDGMYMYAWEDRDRRIFVGPRGEIFLTRSIDYEQQPFYEFLIGAVGSNGERSYKGVRIEVKDVNEPIEKLDVIRFPGIEYPLGSIVGSINAKDPDKNDRITYSIAPETSTPNVARTWPATDLPVARSVCSRAQE